jgi:alpha-aminoadipic semialdehyde synthase
MAEKVQGGKGGFDRAEYRHFPERYRPIFHERVAPYVSVLVNGMYWDHRYPRLLTKSQMRDLAIMGRSRLLAVSDISCDVEGSLEFLSQVGAMKGL